MNTWLQSMIAGQKGWSFQSEKGKERIGSSRVELSLYQEHKKTFHSAPIKGLDASIDYLENIYFLYVFNPFGNAFKGLMFFNKRGVILDNSTLALKASEIVKLLATKSIHKLDEFFFVGDRFTGGNMAHVILDHGARANVASDLKFSSKQLAFYSSTWDWGKELIHSLFDEVKYLEPNQIYHFKKLYLFSNITDKNLGVPTIQFCSAYVQRLKNKLQDKISVNKTHRRIYINRLSATSRSIKNEQEIINYLNHKGFESIDLNEFKPMEQIYLFSEASIIIAPHGAALTNLIACKEGTKVIEFFVGNRKVKTYEKLSELFKLSYNRLDFQLDKGGIPLQQFKQTIEQLLLTIP